ncbi:hypothetical protein UFOVP591_31 [uncultured Caudovirales phage]|mgnify:FL=1|uniref:Uncharacterized protein n=1 Tax=uncultured Caudovirales phage TaxID=2100421 RepID=A0A6J5N2X8_9CAUD|nr:hypothetical protein UFOVP591_31 [uncultured Caudovirales phage]
MCIRCYEKEGSPVSFHPNTNLCVELISEIYQVQSVGGHLHIFSEDWNLYDDDLEFCLNAALKEEDPEDGSSQVIEVCKLLLEMTREQRATVLAVQAGYIKAKPENN